MNRIDNIINEEINKAIITEGVLDYIRNLFRNFTHKPHKKNGNDENIDKNDNRGKETKPKEIKSKEEIRKERKLKKKLEKKKKGRKKRRNLVNGGYKYYDYDDYEKKHRKISKGDIDSIIDSIDQEKTNIAAIARELFPDHTEEGAQSQLRKILNHERPCPKDIASKIEKMIAAGKIAVK